MAGGRGPAPKPSEQRRRRNKPERGEWVELPSLEKPILPELPKRGRGEGRWHPRTVAAWAAWRDDPATTQYGPAEIMAAVELAYIHHSYCVGDEKASEVRLRMDGLGLTPKGKRDLRWRSPSESTTAAVENEPEGGKLAEVRRLRAV
jgi:hypothetical protein